MKRSWSEVDPSRHVRSLRKRLVYYHRGETQRIAHRVDGEVLRHRAEPHGAKEVHGTTASPSAGSAAVVAIAEKWQLPEAVHQAIAASNEYDSSNRQAPVNAVCFANALAKSQGFYPGPCDVEDANALVMIGRSLLSIEDEPVKRLLGTLRERIKSEAM